MNVLDVKTCSCNETHLTSEDIGIKVENVSCLDEEEEENDCALHSFPSIKSEHGNCMDFLKVAPGSYSDTYLPSRDGYQLKDIKVEYIAVIQQEEDPLLITSPVIKSEHEEHNPSVKQGLNVTVNPASSDGGKLNLSHFNPQKGHHLKSNDTSLSQLNESQNQDSLRRAQNSERKRRWRQSRQANETPQEAALRRAQHAQEVRQWRQSRQANETPEEAVSRRAQHAEKMKKWYQSRQANETPHEAALRRAQHAEEVRLWRQLRQANETPQEAASRRAQHAERMRKWYQSRQANETPQEAASRRARHAKRMRKWYQLRQANETPQEAALRRAHHAEEVRQWRQLQQANETCQEAAS